LPLFVAPKGQEKGNRHRAKVKVNEISHRHLTKGDLSTLAQSLIDHDKRPVIPRLQLFIGIEQLDAVHGPVRSEIDVVKS
jgi:hypothetical protein